jgi:hypothetical protein
MVTLELEVEKSKVPEAVVMEAPPIALDVGVQPPKRTVFATLVFNPKLTPFDEVLVELSPLRVIGPAFARISMKSKYRPSPDELELLPEPMPVIVIPPPAAVARIWVPCQPRLASYLPCQCEVIPLLQLPEEADESE